MGKQPKLSLERRAAIELDTIFCGLRTRQGSDYTPRKDALKFLTSKGYLVLRKTGPKYRITAKGMRFYDKEFRAPYDESLARYRGLAKPRIDAIKRSERITSEDLSLYINV